MWTDTCKRFADRPDALLSSSAPQESGLEVWQQLQQRCMKDPAALAVMYEHAQQQLQQRDQQIWRLLQRFDSEQQQHGLQLAAAEGEALRL
jgi:non-ribosomal peptide synthetase component F